MAECNSKTEAGEFDSRTSLLGRIGAALVTALSCLTRLERPGFDRFIAARREKKPLLVVAWHSSMIVPGYCYRNRNLIMMSSLSKDGELMGSIMRRLGFHVIRGSSSRGGTRALLEMVRLMKNGMDGSLTVDGPRGPKHEVKPGAVLLAQKTGARIVPLGMAYSRCLRLNSWDNTEVPLPAARAVQYTGIPFSLPDKMSVEDGCRIIRDRLLACEKAAAEYLVTGVVPQV